jgi:hypothetical protein
VNSFRREGKDLEREEAWSAAEAEASLGWGAVGECARAKAVASHRTPNTDAWGGGGRMEKA